jgi:hypothetical protein
MRTATPILLYISALLFGTYLTFRPTFDSGFAYVQTERGDGMLNHYILENSWLALSDPGYRGSFFTAPFYFPAKWNIYYSENLWGAAPAYWALRLVLPYDLAYAWWQILMNVLNFITFAVVARWLKWPHLLALGGAFMWAFAMVHADQIKHQQLIPRFWMPLALYYAIGLVTGPTARMLNRLLGCIFLQCLACVYTGWFLVAGLSVFIPLLIVMRPGSFPALKAFVRANRGSVFRICAGWGLAMVMLFVPYIVVNHDMSRAYSETYGLMPTPSAWIASVPGAKWSATTAPYRAVTSGECSLFSGFTIYALMLATLLGLVRKRDARTPEHALIAAALLTALVWVLLTLTPWHEGESLWRLVRHAPGGQAIRCVSRVYLVVYLFGSVAALTWLAQVTERIGSAGWRCAVQAVVVGLLVFEQTGHPQGNFARADFYPLVDDTAEHLKGAEVAWVVPAYADTTGYVSTGPYGEVFGMWVGLRANVPVLNGYSGRDPADFPPMGALSDQQIHDWLKGKFRGTVRIVDPSRPGTYRYVVVE